MTGTPSWDTFIILFFIALLAYGFLLQRDKAAIMMISIYMAIVVTAILVDPVAQFFAGEKTFLNQMFIKSNANSFTIQVAIFLLIVGFVSSRSGIEGRNNSSMFELFGLSFLNAALIITTILMYMDPGKREAIAESSKTARLLLQYHTWWLATPVLFLVVTGWSKKD